MKKLNQELNACCLLLFFLKITLWSLETMNEISMDFPLRPQTKTFGKKGKWVS